ncbi:Nucleoside 2-deoxyribosyltransferase [uncultured virus]|nr:Nucleoside 2-deoxyribosyltransferase [uncultured virus]
MTHRNKHGKLSDAQIANKLRGAGFTEGSSVNLTDKQKSRDNKQGVKTLYFAGPLFSIQQIVGNQILADNITKRSKGRYQIILPQELEQSDHNDSAGIRDGDLNAVLSADGILVNFSQEGLDDGTIVEYIISQTVGKPAVVYRTDYRVFTNEEPFNPLLLNYPNTEYVYVDALGLYKQLNDDSQATLNVITDQIIIALDKTFNKQNTLSPSQQFTAEKLVRKAIGLPQ